MVHSRIFRSPWLAVLLLAAAPALGFFVLDDDRAPGARRDMAASADGAVPAVFVPAGMAEVWQVFPQLEGDWLQQADALLRFDPAQVAALTEGDAFGVDLRVPDASWVAVVEQAEEIQGLHVIRGRLLGAEGDRFEMRLSLQDGRLEGEVTRAGERHALVGRYGYGWIHAATAAAPLARLR